MLIIVMQLSLHKLAMYLQLCLMKMKMDKQEERLHLIFSETFFTHTVNKPVNNVAGYYMQKDLVKSNKIQLEV